MSTITDTTVTTASSGFNNKTFYEKMLLERAKTKLVYAQFGKKYSIPPMGGKVVEMRKSNTYAPSTTALKLTEGVTPTGQNYGQTRVLATVEQYGAYVVMSDLLNLTSYDNLIGENSELLGDQLATTQEWVIRDAIVSEASAQYAGGRTSMYTVTATDKMTVDEVRKAVATLDKAKARTFKDGSYVCIVHPDVVYDLQGDDDWKTPNTYSGTKQLYTNELGTLYGVRFVKSTENAITYQSVLNKVNANTTTSADFVLKNAPTDAEIAFLSVGGNKIMVGATEYTLHATTPLTVSGSTYTVKLTTTASFTADDIVWSKDAGAVDSTTKKGVPIHHSIIFGQDFFGIIDVNGGDGIEMIIKQLGEGGDDRLNQRSSVGAKIKAFTAKVLNANWGIDIMSAATLSN